MRTRVRALPLAPLAAVALAVLVATPALAQTAQLTDRESGLTFVNPEIAEAPAPAEAPVPLGAALRSAARFRGVSFLPPAIQATQQVRHEGFGVTFLIGPMFDKLTAENVEETFENQTGLFIALGLGGNRPGNFGVGTDIAYIRRKIDDELTQQILQVPLLFRINVGSSNLSGGLFYIKFGPGFNLIIDKGSEDETFVDAIENFQLDLIIAGGIEITRIGVEFRYDQGLKAIAKEFDEITNIKSRSFMILFVLRLN